MTIPATSVVGLVLSSPFFRERPNFWVENALPALNCFLMVFSSHAYRICYSYLRIFLIPKSIMSSTYCEFLGFFSDIPAVIRVDKTCPDSSVSLTFLHRYNVPRSVVNHDGVAVESTSGPARVPTVDGWYNSRQPFRPAYLSGCDVELGLDWFASVNANFDGSRFQRPLEMDVARLPVGHSWIIQSGSQLVLSTSVSCLVYLYLYHLNSLRLRITSRLLQVVFVTPAVNPL